MLDYIHLYPNKYESLVNEDLIYGRQDTPISEFIITTMKELEAIKNITISKIEIVTDHDEIDMNYHNININYKRKDLDQTVIPKHKFISDGRYQEIIFTIDLKTNLEERTIEKRIAYPEEVNGFMYNAGKKMKPIWQIVDASTYSQRGKSTLKSRMPIIVYTNKKRVITDVVGTSHVITSFSYAVNTKSKRPGAKAKTKFINPISIFAAKLGLENTIRFFGCQDIIKLTNDFIGIDMDHNHAFQISDELWVTVNREMFIEHDIVASVVGMIVNSSSTHHPITIHTMNDPEYWICRIGMVGTANSKNIFMFREKGLNTVLMIERLLDQITIDNLRLPHWYKQNIYYILYWMITEFENLRSRSNVEMKNKRIRRNEYIVLSSLGKKINENINRIIEKRTNSKLADMSALLEVFNFSSDIILSGMRSLNDLVKTDDIANDMDIIMSLSYSAKGYQSIAEGVGKRVANKYRELHPSMVGIIDINTSSNSDVGLSGSFVPGAKLYNRFYFSDDTEPCRKRYEFELALRANGYKRNIKLNSLDSFIKYLEGQDLNKMLEYHPIEIIEREVQ